MALFAIGDIHGCNQTFNALLDKFDFSKQDELVLIGDYIDRGPDSKGVLDTILKKRQQGYTIYCLRGNHEQIFLDAFTSISFTLQQFYRAGGKATLDSFGVKSVHEIDPYYLDFINSLPHFLEIGRFIFVHGGLNFEEANPLNDQDAMLWERFWHSQINYRWLGDRIIIHGHTPITKTEHEGMVALTKNGPDQAINLDTGCVYEDRTGMGVLSAINLDTFDCFYQENID